MQLVYAGADTWILDKANNATLNHWAARAFDIRHITGRSTHEEHKTKTVDIVAILHHWRRRRVGHILKADIEDSCRVELMEYAEQVRLELESLKGGPLEHAPPYNSPLNLARQAGWLSNGTWVEVPLLERAMAKTYKLDWLEEDNT